MSIFTDIRLWAARRRYNPARESHAYPKLQGLLGTGNRVLGQSKPSPANLRYFSRTPYARRAINAIKSPIAALEWEIISTQKGKTFEKQAELITACLSQPNAADSFRSMVEQVIEDALVTGAGVLEQQLSGDAARPIWLWPVDATTVRPVLNWDGKPSSIRYIQSSGYAGGSIMSDIDAKRLEAQEIVYMRMNPSSDTPYGYGPLEVAYMSVQRQLGASEYAANLASNAQPQNLLYAGEVATQEELLAFRAYWRNEVEGQGQTPILAGKVKPEVLKLHPGGDEALYLKYQGFLIREIATAFGISPQNLGIEADVNRNTSEVAEDRDWDSAIKPMAHLIQSHITRDVLHGRLALPYLAFRFVGLDREDEKATADIYATYYTNNAVTPNEQRERIGMPPLKSPWADLCWADVQIAMKAANGAKQVDDPELTPNPGAVNNVP